MITPYYRTKVYEEVKKELTNRGIHYFSDRPFHIRSKDNMFVARTIHGVMVGLNTAENEIYVWNKQNGFKCTELPLSKIIEISEILRDVYVRIGGELE